MIESRKIRCYLLSLFCSDQRQICECQQAACEHFCGRTCVVDTPWNQNNQGKHFLLIMVFDKYFLFFLQPHYKTVK